MLLVTITSGQSGPGSKDIAQICRISDAVLYYTKIPPFRGSLPFFRGYSQHILSLREQSEKVLNCHRNNNRVIKADMLYLS